MKKYILLHSRMLRYLLILPILLASGMASSNNSKGPTERLGAKVDTAAHNSVQYIDDSTLTAQIKSEILKDPLTKNYTINVVTTKGVVDLTGVVDTQATINRAVDIALKYRTASSVKNNLFIKNVK